MNTHRYLEPLITSLSFNSDKMAFVSGPRQCGKTTMAKILLKSRGEGAYYNWDEVKFRRLWTKDPELILPSITTKKSLIILDELHKAKLWKRNIKGLYDTQKGLYDFLVTGSARLNIYRKGSDSLLGRYYHFRLHPFSVAELLKNKFSLGPDELIRKIFSERNNPPKGAEDILKLLFDFGPFPEPLFAEDHQVLNLWQRNRTEKIIREDLRDLSRLPELSQVEMLASLLPERSAQPLSINSLSEDLEVAYTTVKRWLNYLNELYYWFGLKTYAKSLARSLKKENKLYLWDWSEIENTGARYENLVASHLLKYCHYLTDSGVGNFDLMYLKNKEKFEIDFLIVRNKKPFLAIEAKQSDGKPISAWGKFMEIIGCPYGIQLVKETDINRIYEYPRYKILVTNAANFLPYLI